MDNLTPEQQKIVDQIQENIRQALEKCYNITPEEQKKITADNIMKMAQKIDDDFLYEIEGKKYYSQVDSVDINDDGTATVHKTFKPAISVDIILNKE